MLQLNEDTKQQSDVTVSFMKINEEAIIPKYAYDGDACMDISIIINDTDMKPTVIGADESYNTNVILPSNLEPIAFIPPNTTMLFHTGLKCSTPKGFAMKVHVRSSVGIKRNLRLANCTAIIDTAQYRGELMIALYNAGSTSQKIISGERVAQAEIVPVLNVKIEEVDQLSETERGEGGIGSTGK